MSNKHKYFLALSEMVLSQPSSSKLFKINRRKQIKSNKKGL